MKILVTGSNGFIGKNLVAQLNNKGGHEVLEFHRGSDPILLERYAKECEFVFHLAGVNRPKDEKEYMEGNFCFTATLLEQLKKHHNSAPIVFTSSIQAEMDHPYGRSKKAGEALIFDHGDDLGTNVYVYRLPNLFGKWCRPNYNSVVATFCHKIARNLPIEIHDPNVDLTLCYIDDVLEEFFRALTGNETRDGAFCYVPKTHQIKLGELAIKITDFKRNRETLLMPTLESDFDRALYGTFLSYLEVNDFSYPLKQHVDHRGWLAEFIKSKSMGQIFISKTKPGITRGNHWHHTKVEKFLVIQGEALIKLRKIDTHEVIEYQVSGDRPEVVDIPVGYTHAIENVGQQEVITLFWACEIFDVEKPDTYFLEV